jgi:hypothetical protein
MSARGKAYASLHAVFDEQVLAELAGLIVNVSEPARDDENLQFLVDYFWRQPYIEASALGYQKKGDKPWYAETSPDQWGSDARPGGPEQTLRRVLLRLLHSVSMRVRQQGPASPPAAESSGCQATSLRKRPWGVRSCH